MSDNSKKIPFAASLNSAAMQKAQDAIQLMGKALPASVVSVAGQIVTVKFELNGVFTLPHVTCPIYGAEYARMPTQIGDKGVVIPADFYLGGVSGLGGGVAGFDQRANLATLIFFPIGNTGFAAVDANAVVLYGPNGVVVRDTSSASIMTLTPGNIVFTTPGTFTVNAPQIALNGAIVQTGGSAGATVQMQGPLTVTNDITTDATLHATTDAVIAGKSFLGHEHGGVMTGSSNTGVPV